MFHIWERFLSLDLIKCDYVSECLKKALALKKDVSQKPEWLLEWGLAVKIVLSNQSALFCASVSLHAKSETWNWWPSTALPILKFCDSEKGNPVQETYYSHSCPFPLVQMHLDSSKWVLTRGDQMSSFRRDGKGSLANYTISPTSITLRASCQGCYNPTARSQLEQKRQ